MLTWNTICRIGEHDKFGRWYPNPDIAEYFSSLRAPSRAWPHSYARAAQTKKFASWLLANRPDIAARLGVTE
jgi:hypothetical protein